MSRTRHTKKDFLGNKGTSPHARSATSRHPHGTKAKGLRKDMRGFIDYKGLKDRFGDAYEQSSRLHRIKRWIKKAARAKGKRLVEEAE